jgi:hypothetical protein
MAKRWTHIRIPIELHERLMLASASMLASYQAGLSSLPPDQCERVSLAFVVETALNDRISHQTRGRHPRRRNTRPMATVAPDADVLTPVAENRS